MQVTPPSLRFFRFVSYFFLTLPFLALIIFLAGDIVYGFDGFYMLNVVWGKAAIANVAMVAMFLAVLFSFTFLKNNDSVNTSLLKGAFFLTNLFCARLLMPDIDYYLFVLISIIFIILGYNMTKKGNKKETALLVAFAMFIAYAVFRHGNFIGGLLAYTDMQPNPIVFLMPMPLLFLLHHNKKFLWIPVILVAILFNPTGKFVTIAMFPIFYALMIDLKLPKNPSIYLILVICISLGVYLMTPFYALESAKVALNDCCTKNTCYLTSTECVNWRQFFIYRDKILIENSELAGRLASEYTSPPMGE